MPRWLQALDNPRATVVDVARLLSQDYADECTQAVARRLLYRVVEAADGSVAVAGERIGHTRERERALSGIAGGVCTTRCPARDLSPPRCVLRSASGGRNAAVHPLGVAGDATAQAAGRRAGAPLAPAAHCVRSWMQMCGIIAQHGTFCFLRGLRNC